VSVESNRQRPTRPTSAPARGALLVAGLCLFATAAAAQSLEDLITAAATPATEGLSAALTLTQPGQGPVLAALKMNGVETGEVYEFVQRNGGLFVTVPVAREMGLKLDRTLGAQDLVDLTRLAGVRVAFDPRASLVEVIAEMAALTPHVIEANETLNHTARRPNAAGAALNYDASMIANGTGTAFSGYLDARVFGRFGSLQQRLLTSGPVAALQLTRLNTTYVYADANRLIRFEAGDVISAGSSWTRPIGLAGFQLRRDFSLRPDLITFPTPTLSGSAVVPSTLDVYVNEIRRFSTKVETGPFVLSQPPIVAGGGKIQVTMRDEAGRETLITQPFYTSTALLRPGMYAYSIEAGRLRRNFNSGEPSYGDWAAAATLRRGLTPALTGQFHLETTNGLTMAGAGASLTLGAWAAAEFAASASRSDRGGGRQVHASVERIEPGYSLIVAATASDSRFRDIASQSSAEMPKLTLHASGGFSLTERTGVQLTYIDRRYRARDQANDRYRARDQANDALASLGLTHNVRRANLYGVATHDFKSGATLLSVGLSMPLGGQASVSAGAQASPRESTAYVEAAKFASDPGDIGWRFGASEGAGSSQRGEVQYRSTVGLASLGFDRRPGQTEARAGARGGLAYLGGRVYASDTIYDSFAVVETGRPGMMVLQENRPIGRTNAQGRLLVSNLRAYEDNQLALDALDVPMDADPKTMTLNIHPSAPGGWLIPFDLREGHSALLTLIMTNGDLVPMGSRARDERTQERYTVGYDGFVFLHDLRANNSVSVTLPDGATCSAVFEYRDQDGELPEIGPTLCIPTAPS
jgi:outer membrane usher protein